MKKLFILSFMLCLLGGNRAWAGDDFIYFGIDHDHIVHNLVKNRSSETEVASVDCYFRYYNNGTEYTSIYEDYKFKVEIIGDLQMAEGSAFTYNGQERSDITAMFQIKFKGRGGAIIVWANGYKGNAVGWQTYFVITAPYIGNQTWDFFTNPNLNIKQETLPHWKESTKFNGHPERPLKVVDTSFDKADAYKNDSHDGISGTNARYIPETAGLIFDVSTDKFGINDNTKINPENNQPYKTKNYVVLGGYGTLTIPHVKAGSYVKVWMDAMDSGKWGSHYKATNLKDLEDKPIVNNFNFTGVTDYDKLSGCMIFKVDGNDGEYKDVSLKLEDDGYTDIYRIEVTDTYSTDMVLFQCKNMDDGWKVGGAVAYNNEYAHIVHDGVNLQERYYNGTPGIAVLQRAKTCEFKIEKQGSVNCSDYIEQVTTSQNTTYNYLHLEDISGTGNIKIIQREKFGEYVLNKKETWIAVGEYNKQNYPYTWDFTDYNVGKGHLLVADNDNGAPNGWLKNWTDEHMYGCWNPNNSFTGLETHTQVETTDNWQKDALIDKPTFAQGSQLTHNVYKINEALGLRVKQLAGTFEDGSEKYAVGAGYDGEIQIDGQALIYTPKVSGDKLQLTIPGVGNDMYVFVDASTAPIVTGASSLEESEKHSPNSDVYEYKGTGTDVALTFDKASRINRIGVTNIIKPINKYGYATESRDRTIDHFYTGDFTQNDVNAYFIKSFNKEASTVTLVPTDVVPANTGLVLYKSGTTQAFSSPLFVKACNVNPEDMTGNLLQANVTSSSLGKSTNDKTNFVLTDISYYIKDMTSKKMEGEDNIGFYRVGQTGTLGANKSYLQLPTADLNTNDVTAKGVMFILWLDDEELISEEQAGVATLIENVNHSSADSNVFYNLNGQKIEKMSLSKGVYIVNGKKVIVK